MHLGIARASRRQAIAGLIALLAGAALPARAHAEVFTPPRGSELRADILDALRPTVADEIGGAIEFVVSSLRVQGNWAYASVRPQRPNGLPIDWSTTKFRREWDEGVMSDDVLALLRRDAGGWRVVEYVIGPTDVYWENWIEPNRVQRRLFTDE
jgi:hypothetical protein